MNLFAKLCVPTTNVKTGNFNKDIQVMHGVTKDEALLLLTSLILDPSSYDTFKNNWNILGPALILDTLGSEVTEADTQLSYQLVERYIGDLQTNFNPEHFENITNLVSDAFFW